MKPSHRLACFSPLVMLLTFTFEFAAAAFVFWRYRFDRRAVIIIALLINLGVFQIAEWNICAHAGASLWARIGFIGTAILIPLGFNLLNSLIPSKLVRFTTYLAWSLAIGFIAWFLLIPSSVTLIFCGGNYSIYRLSPGMGNLYGLFYTSFLLVHVVESVWSLQRLKQSSPQLTRAKPAGKSATIRATQALVIGLLSFIIPTLFSNALSPETIKAIPSILCGFAIFFAIIIVTMIAPASLRRRGE